MYTIETETEIGNNTRCRQSNIQMKIKKIQISIYNQATDR